MEDHKLLRADIGSDIMKAIYLKNIEDLQKTLETHKESIDLTKRLTSEKMNTVLHMAVF